MDPSVTRHCAELNRYNQRGGRMLSVFDLLESGTLDFALAAYLMEVLSRGASLMVGARPGGAGKTTVMCALLNLMPADVELVAATAEAVRTARPVHVGGRRCYVCHEVGAGRYFAYLWGANLRAYCGLCEMGHLLATNLHADDMEEAQEQLCGENGVPAAHFNAFRVLVFLGIGGGYGRMRRRVEKVYVSDGRGRHRTAYDSAGGLLAAPSENARMEACRAFLEEQYHAGIRTIEDARARVLTFLSDRTLDKGSRQTRGCNPLSG